jgi:hypothetical protein
MSSQPPKDFLALSHGHEWVNFYESFDKLVQDHLSRSSELLRKAMSLPEVADREVAQVRTDLESQLAAVRTELEGKLAAERQQHQAALNSLKAEISSSHQQAASLARMFGSLLTDLDRLSSTVDSALSAQAEAVAVSATEAVVEVQAVTEASALAEEATEEAVAEASTESPEWSAEAVAEESGEAESESSDGEALSGDGSEIDLNALAAAETESGEETSDVESYVAAADENESTESSSDEGDSGFTPHVEPERPRPHWLSVARSNSSH